MHYFFFFILYPAGSSVGRGSLVLRHFVPIKTPPFHTFRRILEALCVKWQNLTPLREIILVLFPLLMSTYYSFLAYFDHLGPEIKNNFIYIK